MNECTMNYTIIFSFKSFSSGKCLFGVMNKTQLDSTGILEFDIFCEAVQYCLYNYLATMAGLRFNHFYMCICDIHFTFKFLFFHYFIQRSVTVWGKKTGRKLVWMVLYMPTVKVIKTLRIEQFDKTLHYIGRHVLYKCSF